MKPGTLCEALFTAVREFPEHGIGYIGPDQKDVWEPYPELLDHAYRILTAFQRKGIKPGDRIIISLNKVVEEVPVLWACFLGGIIPALLQPPVSFSEYNPAAEKAEKVFRILGRPWVVLSHIHYDSWLKSGVPRELLIDHAALCLDQAKPQTHTVKPDDLAMIQFSSGSTGDPKGIMLTHKNLMCNIYDIHEGLKQTVDDMTISWMPLYHDMGLIGFHLTPVAGKWKHYLIDPVDFIKNPGIWLDALSAKKATITGCPNFGQMLVNKYVQRKQNDSWDFSGIRTVFNGAEPISAPTMREFNTLLSPYGYRAQAMLPAYGMAEATLAITFASLEEEPIIKHFKRSALLSNGLAQVTAAEDTDAMELVSVGRPLTHCNIRLVDQEGTVIGDDFVGNVEVKGDNVTSGYYNNHDATSATIVEGWLKTGDLGFRHDSELYIMGRAKDVIFINGTNYYASDLETIALQMKELVPGRVVMAGYFDEKERCDKVIVFLVAPDNETTRATFLNIQRHFQHSVGLLIETFIPIRSNDIPRTSSGKIQRYKMVSRFLKQEFPVVVKI